MVGWTVAALLLVGVLVVVTVQVDVGEGDAARACGSAFDTMVDNSGWRQWWAQDLAETDAPSRAALLRTHDCPGAINRNIVIAGGLVSAALVAVVYAERPWTRRGGAPQASAARRVHRIGVGTAVVGSVLTVGGLIALLVLVADADSTLFLYVDRSVSVVVGLIVLVPTIALIVIGWVLVLVASSMDEQKRREPSARP